MTDQDIINFFSDKNGKINTCRVRKEYLEKHNSSIKNYLENRYEEFTSYTHVVKCIMNHLDNLPRCETCGNILMNIRATYCSDKCRANGHSYKSKMKSYYLEIYGVENPAQSEIIKDKIANTNLEKYGAKNVYASKEIIQKCKDTKAKKHGNANYNNRQKASQTCLTKYNAASFVQSKKFTETRKRKYYFDGIGFDSIPEVAFYVYHKDLGHSVKHEPIQFVYYCNNKKRIYNPDFEIDGILYEIKGKHFFRDGKMINPFDESQNDLYEAKHQCMKNHSVIIITDVSKYVEYLFNTYKLDNLLRKE